MFLLSIETSCDETAVSIFNLEPVLRGGDVFSYSALLAYEKISSQVKLHEPYGGVVPELAAREHGRNLPLMVAEAFKQVGIVVSDLAAISVTSGPGLNGCLLVGLSYAKAMAAALKVPLISLHHIEGHMFAGALEVSELEFPQLTLIVSGGHSELVLVNGLRDYQILSRTKDDAAGEAFDKIASILGLPYPGGPSLAKRAAKGNPKAFAFPIGAKEDPSSFSFSGLKTSVLRQVRQLSSDSSLSEEAVDDIAASAQEAICQALVLKTAHFVKPSKARSLVLTGGVAANLRLRELFLELATNYNLKLVVPPMRWCTDNASMMGVLAIKLIERKREIYLNWKCQDGFLGPETPASIGATPRWPIEDLEP